MQESTTLSASAIDAFKACPIRYRNRYVHKIVSTKETDSRRLGTEWHKLLELNEDMDAVTAYVNEQYATIPPDKTRQEWLVERIILLYSIAGYRWYYRQQPNQYEIIASEVEFEMPLFHPGYNAIVPGVLIRGKIDQIVRDEYGLLYIREFKSTSKSLDDETYWNHLNLDVQVSLYLLAARYLQQTGNLKKYGIEPKDPLISRILYNVWHKPQIQPKFLTQKDSKEFVKTGEYYGEHFEIEGPEFKTPLQEDSVSLRIEINDEQAIIEPGKREGTYAIYETPEMFGARLMADIVERPEFYFQERELSRTDKDMEKFIMELYNTYQAIKYQQENNCWYSNEWSCQSRFRCEYMPICYGNMEINLDSLPDGFIVKGQEDE